MNLIINSEKLTNIANALRGRLKTETEYNPDEMVDAVNDMYKDIEGGYITLNTSEGSDTVDTVIYHEMEKITSNHAILYKNIIVGEGCKTFGFSKFTTATATGVTTVKNIILPSTLKEISNSAFIYMRLENLDIPDGVETIGDKAFYECSFIKNLSIPDGVTSIGSYAFRSVPIENFVFPSGIKIISEGVCENIKAKSIYIPDGVTTINKSAFGGNSSMKTIFIPSSVTSIPASAKTYSPFWNCQNLSDIYTDALTKPTGWQAYYYYVSNTGTATVHYGVTREEYEQIIQEEQEVSTDEINDT